MVCFTTELNTNFSVYSATIFLSHFLCCLNKACSLHSHQQMSPHLMHWMSESVQVHSCRCCRQQHQSPNRLSRLVSRAATANTRWIRAARRPTRLSTTTSATPPTTTRGGGSRRACPAHRRTATRSPTPWWSRRRDSTHRPCPPCLHSCSRAPHPLSCRARAPCSGQREAGLPHPLCCPLNPPASTAPSIGPPAAWAVPPRPRLPDSPPLFDAQ